MRSVLRSVILYFLTMASPLLAADQAWRESFPVVPSDLASTGRGRFFILEPRFQLVLAGGDERLEITVLDETRIIAGVETRVIEERESEDGRLIEVSRNFFAIDRKTGDAYYFGEEVDIYRDGKVAAHSGAWLAGTGGAKMGLIMPGQPKIGDRYYQEVAPKVAMDRAEVVSLTSTVKTPAGDFKDVLETVETTPLEPNERESKFYAPGIGLVREGQLRLVKFGPITLPRR